MERPGVLTGVAVVQFVVAGFLLLFGAGEVIAFATTRSSAEAALMGLVPLLGASLIFCGVATLKMLPRARVYGLVTAGLCMGLGGLFIASMIVLISQTHEPAFRGLIGVVTTAVGLILFAAPGFVVIAYLRTGGKTHPPAP